MTLENNTSAFVGQVFAYKLNFIASLLAKQGVDKTLLIKDTNITADQLKNPECRVNKEQVVIFYRNVLALKIPGIGFLLGKSITMSDYGLWGCTLLCCKDLRSAIEFSIRYHNLATKTVNMSLLDDKGNVYSYYRFEDLLLEADLIEFNITLQCAFVQSLIYEYLDTKQQVFEELRFSFSRPKQDQLYEEHFQCPVSYDNPYTEFVLSKEKLDLPPPKSNPFAMPLLLNQCDMVLESISSKNELLTTINQWVASNMHTNISSADLAEYLCSTPRTLRRKLAEQGTSFRDIVKELRCEAAKKLIRETELTIEDVGYAVGFSDTSNFRAAFKKWTGVPPSSLRQVAGKE